MEDLGALLAWSGVGRSRAAARTSAGPATRGWWRCQAWRCSCSLPRAYGTALSLDLLWRVHFFSSLRADPAAAASSSRGRAGARCRYYLRDSAYRADGPPHPMARLSAPILVLSTIVLFVSGVVMMLDGDRFAPWSTVHNGAAIVFTGALGLHLLAHLWGAARLRSARRSTCGRSDRRRRHRSRRGPAARSPITVGGRSWWASPSPRWRCRARSGRRRGPPDAAPPRRTGLRRTGGEGGIRTHGGY